MPDDAKPDLAQEEHFWGRVKKTPTCWLWTGQQSDGYGRMQNKSDGPRTLSAHRFAYGLLVGPIPAGKQLDHLCRVTTCVNPAHMEVVDNRTNVLRGIGHTAVNARKTHCPRGHELSGKNLYQDPSGRRRCRTCRRAQRHGYTVRRVLVLEVE